MECFKLQKLIAGNSTGPQEERIEGNEILLPKSDSYQHGANFN